MRSLVRGTVTLAVTLAVLAGAGGGVVALSGFLGERSSASVGPAPEPPVAVATRTLIRTDGYAVTRRFVGTIEPARRTDVAFELPGVVDAVLVDEGDLVGAGETIATIDTALLEADRVRLLASTDALEAQAELARLTLERRLQLNERGFASGQSLDEIRLGEVEIAARIAEARAGLAGIDVRLAKSEVRAPFEGRVALRSVDDGAVVEAGRPVVTLIEEREPRMRVGIDPDLAGALGEGTSVGVEIAGSTVRGTVERVLPDLDPATRTLTVLVALDVAPAEAVGLYGRTGTVAVEETIDMRGAWVPLDALREGARGTWTVLTLPSASDGAVPVAVEAVEVLHADGARAFVRGTFAQGADLIETGPHRVVPGQIAIDRTHPEASVMLAERATLAEGVR